MTTMSRSNCGRPAIECHFGDGEQFVDRSAVARLNGHAFHDRIDEFAQHGRIGAGRKLSLRGAVLQTLDQEGLRRDTLVAQQAFDGGGRRRNGCRCRIHEAAGRRSRFRE